MEKCSERDSSGFCTGTCFVGNIFYNNSMPSTVKSKQLYLFADDAKLYREITSNKDVELLKEELRKLEEWSKKSFFLHFNENKCVLMIISNGGSNHATRSYEIYDKQLETAREEKDLEMIIDSKHSFDSHIFAN